MPDVDIVDEIDNFEKHFTSISKFPNIDTQSNLWPSVLSELLMDADLSTSVVDKHSAKLKTLVARRNGIAHGENNFISDYLYYKGYEDAVYEVMYDLAFQIELRLTQPPYI